MEDKFQFIECKDDDVVEFEGNIYRIGQINKALDNLSDESLAQELREGLESENIYLNDSYEYIFDEGVICEILNLGSHKWKKGKFKFKLIAEFYVEEDEEVVQVNNMDSIKPTEPESPLDDLRRLINEEQNK